jgi:FixJ family two-component response regulator
MDATVHLIDSDPGAVQIVCGLLESTAFSVEPHPSTAEFLNGRHSVQPGCLVVNLGGSGIDGIEFLRRLNSHEAPPPTIFVTDHADLPDVVSLMQLGAVSLLEKPYRKRALLAALQSAVRLDAERRMVAARLRELRERVDSLSEDERIVLQDLVAGNTNKGIATRRGIALRTVEYRRHNIFAKLRVHSIAEMAVTVAELERLADVRAMLQTPPLRLADSRFTSLCVPMRMRTAGRNWLVLDSPFERPPAPVSGARAIPDTARN